MKRILSTAVATAATIVLAASGASAAFADPSDDPSSAAAELCTNLTELNSDTAALRALNPANATKDQIKEAYDDVQKSWSEVDKSTATWDAAKKDSVKKAAEDLKKAYEGLPGDTTGKDAASKLAPSVMTLDDATKSAKSGLTC
ncbi:hypothetical protein [Streptomyces sp. NPDC051000]|uniref:hypothetical protein n=1 Tax=unclassified Streptomyces TaxID=2593676 RepID=UPI0033F8BD8E